MYKLSKYQIIICTTLIGTFLAVFVIVQSIKFIELYITTNEQLSEQPQQHLIVTIDCETELREGDMISARLYDPLGEWRAISQDTMQYQLKHGGRLIQCK